MPTRKAESQAVLRQVQALIVILLGPTELLACDRKKGGRVYDLACEKGTAMDSGSELLGTRKERHTSGVL